MIRSNLPPGSLVEKIRGKRRYYYYSRSYRVKINPQTKGKTKGSGKSKVITDQVYMGTAESVMEKICHYVDHPKPLEIQKKKFGLPVTLFEVAERIGLRQIINDVVPGRVQGICTGDFVLIAAINRVGNHTSKEQMGRWYQKTALGEIQRIVSKDLNSKSFWYAFDRLISERPIKEHKEARGFAPNEKLDIDELEAILDDRKIEKIEEKIWSNLHKEFDFFLDVVLYDTTNFYSYYQPETPNCLGQFGKNKQNQNDKRQVGLQLAILRDLGIPIFHNVYCGHQNDATLFPTAIRELIKRYHALNQSTERLVLIFDKGNNSRKNFSLLSEDPPRGPIEFVGVLHPTHYPDLVRIPLEQYDQKIGKYRVYRTKKEIFGTDRTVVMTYNREVARRKERIFEAHMKQALKEARAFFKTIAQEPRQEIEAQMRAFLKTQKVGSSQARRYYQFELQFNGLVTMFHMRRIRSEVALKKASFGKNLIFTSLDSEQTETILAYSKSGYQIENSFHHIKDRDLVPYHPVYHWTDSKIRVHAFVCVMALLLLRLTQYIAKKNGVEMSSTLLIEELEDITLAVTVYSPRKLEKNIHTMSTVQKRLFDIFDLQKYIS